MPESQQPEVGTSFISQGTLKNPRRRVLDIGAGEGKWGRLLKGKVDFVAGVEVWEPYISRYDLNSKYDQLIHSDARELDFSSYPKFDVAILGDVLEHLPYEDAKVFIEKLKQNVSEIYLSIPITICIQDAANGNPFEEHLYHWMDREIRNDLGFTLLNVGANPNGLVAVGTYVWKQ